MNTFMVQESIDKVLRETFPDYESYIHLMREYFFGQPTVILYVDKDRDIQKEIKLLDMNGLKVISTGSRSAENWWRIGVHN